MINDEKEKKDKCLIRLLHGFGTITLYSQKETKMRRELKSGMRGRWTLFKEIELKLRN